MATSEYNRSMRIAGFSRSILDISKKAVALREVGRPFGGTGEPESMSKFQIWMIRRPQRKLPLALLMTQAVVSERLSGLFFAIALSITRRMSSCTWVCWMSNRLISIVGGGSKRRESSSNLIMGLSETPANSRSTTLLAAGPSPSNSLRPSIIMIVGTEMFCKTAIKAVHKDSVNSET